MIIILSPSKTQNMEMLAPTELFTEPHFEEERWLLKRKLQLHTEKEIKNILKISDPILQENLARMNGWTKRHTQKNSKQAIHVFSGAVYDSLHQDTYTQKQYAYMQRHIRILSGLYGVIRPLDLIQPYRLEMGTKFSFVKKKEGVTYKNLYEFWKPVLTRYFSNQKDSNLIIDLASLEYSKVIDKKAFNPRWIQVEFLQKVGKEYTPATIYTKQARGALAHWMVKNDIKSLEDMQDFTEGGYKYMPSRSKGNIIVFARKHPRHT